MLFLAFLHKITQNCKVRDYKNAPKVPCLRGVSVNFYKSFNEHRATLTGGRAASRQEFLLHLEDESSDIPAGDEQQQTQHDASDM